MADVLAAVPALKDGLEPCLPALVGRLRGALGADVGAAYSVDAGAGRTQVTEMVTCGASCASESDFRASIEAAPPGWAHYDPSRPDPAQRNVALTRTRLGRITGKGRSWIEETALARCGLAHLDQLRVLVCDGPSLLAWVGAFREEPFGRREQRILGALVPALQNRLRLERSAADAPLLRAALESTMETLPAPAFLVDRKGAPRHANTAGRVLLESDRAAHSKLRDAVRGGLPNAQLTPVVAPGLAPHFLVLLEPPADETGHRVALARVRWALTPRQADVLALIASGESNKTIAARLGCEVKTAEAHVTALLRKSGCESRTALVARLLALRAG